MEGVAWLKDAWRTKSEVIFKKDGAWEGLKGKRRRHRYTEDTVGAGANVWRAQ